MASGLCGEITGLAGDVNGASLPGEPGRHGTLLGRRARPIENRVPVWEAAEDQGAVVFIHPFGCQFGDRLHDHYLGNVIGQPLESTIAVSKLILGGVLDRYPQLKIYVAHGGGYLPFYPGRLDRAWKVRPEARTCKELPSTYLNRIWYDTVVHSAELLTTLVSCVGADRVMLGTDYPYDMGIENPLELLEKAPDLETHQRSAIAGENARSLLGI